MNPFQTGDRVQCKAKNRRHGTVVRIYCGKCEKCITNNDTSNCVADAKDKVKVLASFFDGHATKRFKYDYSELEIEPPLPEKPIKKIYDFSPKDIRPLGDIVVDIPLIEYELGSVLEIHDEDIIEVQEIKHEKEEEEEYEKQESRKHRFQTNLKSKGTFFDQFLRLSQNTMRKPV